jgi:hypothetical protein
MSVSTVEGYVENGQIRLVGDVKLPEKAKVYVVIPDVSMFKGPIRILSPHLAHREDLAKFHVQMVEDEEKP